MREKAIPQSASAGSDAAETSSRGQQREQFVGRVAGVLDDPPGFSLQGAGSHITLQPKTGCPLKLSRVEPGQYLDGRPPEKTRLLLEEVLVRPAGGAHPVVCVGPNTPV